MMKELNQKLNNWKINTIAKTSDITLDLICRMQTSRIPLQSWAYYK